jgi:hypothetical protein
VHVLRFPLGRASIGWQWRCAPVRRRRLPFFARQSNNTITKMLEELTFKIAAGILLTLWLLLEISNRIN